MAATLFTPDDGGQHSGIVMCQGAVGAMQFFGFPDIARRFAELGHAVLIFDHRGFGGSEGERGRTFALEQVQDIRDAMSFLQAQPEVDPERIALFGTSIGGGSAVYASAIDSRARWTISAVGFGDGERMVRAGRDDTAWQEFLAEIKEDRQERVVTGRSQLIPRSRIAQRDERSLEVRARVIGGNPGAEAAVPDLTLESAERLIEFRPVRMAGLIAPRSVLFISAEEDQVTPADGIEAMFAAAGEPKAYECLPGIGHYEVYEEPHVSRLIALTHDWINAS
jgi:dienelactone hydrolase